MADTLEPHAAFLPSADLISTEWTALGTPPASYLKRAKWRLSVLLTQGFL